MDILILSKTDSCAAVKAQSFLVSFGRGMKVYAADATEVVASYADKPWDYVISLCERTDNLKNLFHKEVGQWRSIVLGDIFSDEQTEELRRRMYELYRDELKEQLLPRCTCGANDFCKCE